MDTTQSTNTQPIIYRTPEDNKLLVNLCRIGSTEQVKRLLTIPGAVPLSALKVAVERGHAEVVRALLAYNDEESGFGVDPSYGGDVILALACSSGRQQCVLILIADERVDPSAHGNLTLRMACMQGWNDVFDAVLRNPRFTFSCPGFNINDVLMILDETPNYHMTYALITNPRTNKDRDIGHHMMRNACEKGWYDIVRLMLKVEVSIDTWSPCIFWCVRNDRINILRLLLADDRCELSNHIVFTLSRAIEENKMSALKVLVIHPKIGGGIKVKGTTDQDYIAAAYAIIKRLS